MHKKSDEIWHCGSVSRDDPAGSWRVLDYRHGQLKSTECIQGFVETDNELNKFDVYLLPNTCSVIGAGPQVKRGCALIWLCGYKPGLVVPGGLIVPLIERKGLPFIPLCAIGGAERDQSKAAREV